MNDYYVPTAYVFRDVLVKGLVEEVVIFCGALEIARHPRSYGRGEFVFEPRHYLALLEQKPGAFDQAAPLQQWILPEPLQRLRRLMESCVGNRGKREFIQVLRLMEVISETVVANAAPVARRRALGRRSERKFRPAAFAIAHSLFADANASRGGFGGLPATRA